MHQKIVNNFSFLVDRPGVYGLIGESGSGKSSILKLIMGLYPKLEGKIFVNSHEVHNGVRTDLSKFIQLLSQDVVLSKNTLLENLKGNNISARSDEIKNILDICDLSDWISTLPLGLDTQISESMLQISGGTRQRIALAQCLISDKNILLLDEPTSALDTETAEKIYRKIKNNFKNKIILIVSHDVELLTKYANKVWNVKH